MGRLRIIETGNVREQELAPSTLVGRHGRCQVRLDDARVPTTWLEVRWQGDHWVWRLLVDSGATRGTGTVGEHGWRVLQNGTRPGRVTCCDGVAIELADSGPPRAQAMNLHSGEILTGDDFDAHFEVWEGQVRPAGWDVSTANGARAATSGGVVVVGSVAYEVSLPDQLAGTERGELDLTHPDLRLEVSLEPPRAVFTLGSIEVALKGEPVRILALYARVRQAEHFDDGGWLTRDEVHAAWLESRERSDTPAERMAWERGKVRTLLSKRGARRLESLFEVRRRDGHVQVRLSLSPDQIEVVT